MRCLLVLATWIVLSSGADEAIIANLDGISDTASDTPSTGSPFSWSDAHSSCRNNNPTIEGSYGFCTNVVTDSDSYFQVDLQDVYDISSVGIKGRADCCTQWVKTYNLLYSLDGINFSGDGINNPLTGNSDKTTEVTTSFASDIEARYLRVIPITYNDWKSFRFEAYGELANPECQSIDIDGLLDKCSSLYSSLEESTLANADRLDNLIANSVSFYSNNPDQSSAHSIFGNNDFYERRYPSDNNMWFTQNKDNLLILSLIMNVLIIIFGSCICMKAGVCSKAFGAQKVIYRKVKPYVSSDDDENRVIVRRQ